jgi:hypothetical protein
VSKILKNQTASPVNISDVGQIVPASGQLTVQPQDYWLYAASDDVITFIGDSTLVVNDGTVDLSINDGAKLIQGIFPNPVGIAAGDDGTPIGHVGDKLKVTALSSKSAFDSSGGTTIGLVETSIVIPLGTLKYKIQAVNPRTAKLSIASAATGTSSNLTSFDIYPGNSWEEELNGEAALTIYIKSSKTATVVQVVTWT